MPTKSKRMPLLPSAEDREQIRRLAQSQSATHRQVQLACGKPKDLGHAAELWTRKSLAQYVREHAASEGHRALARAAKATIQRILAEQEVQPHRVRYYMERRDPEFEAKMKEVLLVYREVATAPVEGLKTADGQPLYTAPIR